MALISDKNYIASIDDDRVKKGVWMIQWIIRLKQLNSISINQVLTLINTNVKQISSLKINDSSILFYKEIESLENSICYIYIFFYITL